jgi:hypothetical protein
LHFSLMSSWLQRGQNRQYSPETSLPEGVGHVVSASGWFVLAAI